MWHDNYVLCLYLAILATDNTYGIYFVKKVKRKQKLSTKNNWSDPWFGLLIIIILLVLVLFILLFFAYLVSLTDCHRQQLWATDESRHRREKPNYI